MVAGRIGAGRRGGAGRPVDGTSAGAAAGAAATDLANHRCHAGMGRGLDVGEGELAAPEERSPSRQYGWRPWIPGGFRRRA
jgi:hypothetical protein